MLGALDAKGDLTDPVGTSLSRLPVDPMFGKAREDPLAPLRSVVPP